MISVLMPVYNGESHLREAIDSILNQTFSDFEFIIINDGSTDRSEEIILSYNDTRIKYIKNEKNLGIVETLNKGLGLANHKYIARMDADDISMPHRFQKQVEFMEAHPEIVASGSNVIKFYTDIYGKTNISNIKTDHKDLIVQSFFFSAFWHPSMILRTKTLHENKLKYISNYNHAEDKALWIEMAQHGEMANLIEPLVYYRVHEDQVSTKYFDEQHDESMTLTRNSLKKVGVDMDKFSDKIIAYIAYPRRCYDLSEIYQVETFMKDTVKALSYNPAYDSDAVKIFMKEQVLMTLYKSQNIGFPLLSYIYSSNFVDISDFDLRYFIKVILRRNTKKIEGNLIVK